MNPAVPRKPDWLRPDWDYSNILSHIAHNVPDGELRAVMLNEAITWGALYPPVGEEAALAERLLPAAVALRRRDIAEQRRIAHQLATTAQQLQMSAAVDEAVVNYAETVQAKHPH
jgi:hypothetical protein